MNADHDRVQVRAGASQDVPGIIECSAALFAEDAGTRDPSINVSWPREYGSARFAEIVDDPDRLVLVAEATGEETREIVGFLTGTLSAATPIRPEPGVTLLSMYVLPEYRRKLIGAQLVARFLAWAKEHGARRAEVTANSANPEAIRFYQRNGFTIQSVNLTTNI